MIEVSEGSTGVKEDEAISIGFGGGEVSTTGEVLIAGGPISITGIVAII